LCQIAKMALCSVLVSSKNEWSVQCHRRLEASNRASIAMIQAARRPCQRAASGTTSPETGRLEWEAGFIGSGIATQAGPDQLLDRSLNTQHSQSRSD
jgi:hypothetical protein